MKKNKLYTANRWNQPAFMPDRKNLFAPGGPTQTNFKFVQSAYGTDGNPNGSVVNTTSATQINPGDVNRLSNSINQSVPLWQNNNNGGLFSKNAWKKGGIGWAGAGLGASALGSINTGEKRGMWDTLDPVHHLAGGRESGAGNAMGDAGVALTQAGLSSGNPYLMLAGAGAKVLGGLTNAAFGIKTDQARLNQINEGLETANNFVSDASTFDDIEAPISIVSADGVYEGGWFSGGRAARKNAELKARRAAAVDWMDRSVSNNIYNITNDFIGTNMRNYAAFGGPLDTSYDDMGAVNYGFMSDYLTQKKRENDMKNKMSGLPSVPAFMPNSFAIGGDLQTNGADWSDGLTIIGAGGSHSENPYEGVQLGTDENGTPNLVEENETVWNDYVFSARIPIDDTTKEMFHIGKKREMTYADLSKKLEKEIAERVNDPISKSGFEKQMQMLEEQQERQKQEMEAERARAAFEALSPEEQTALMQQRAEQEALAQQAAMQEAATQQQPVMQPTPEEIAMAQQQQMIADGSEPNLGQEPQMNCMGGKINKFDEGGPKKHPGKFKDPKGMWDKYTKKGLEEYLGQLETRIAMAPDEATRNAIRQKAIETFNKIQTGYKGIYPSEESDMYPYSDAVRNHQIAFNDNYGNTGFYTTDANGNVTNLIAQDIDIPNGGDVEDVPINWADGYWGPRTSIRNFGSTEYGDAEHYKALADRFAKLGLKYAPNEEWKYGKDDHTLYGLSLIEPESQEPPRWDYGTGDWVKPDGTPATPESPSDKPASSITVPNPEPTPQRGIRPVYRNEALRYAGLFGPAVGLGMQMAGIGRPDTSGLDAALNISRGAPHLAKYKPIGNYLTYKPMDIWFEQNRNDANSRATDRMILNNSAPVGTRMAGLLANSYNNQIANGQLFRQALEYNDAQRKKVTDFNRATDMFNADAYNRLSQFNASARNQARQANAQLGLHAAVQKMNADAAWNSGIYGNVAGLFKGIGDLGRENYQHNRIADMAATGLFGTINPDTFVANGYLTWDDKKRSKGGKINRKKGGRK